MAQANGDSRSKRRRPPKLRRQLVSRIFHITEDVRPVQIGQGLPDPDEFHLVFLSRAHNRHIFDAPIGQRGHEFVKAFPRFDHLAITDGQPAARRLTSQLREPDRFSLSHSVGLSVVPSHPPSEGPH